MSTSWRDRANAVLSRLYRPGKPAPTKQELLEAYPFGIRKHTPYKVWLEQVRAWKAAYAKGAFAPPAIRDLAGPKADRANADASTGRLL